MKDLTVWCVCVGTKYHPGYVYALRDMVAKYLTIPHELKCITTLNLPGIYSIKPFVPYQGWWSKINLFAPHMATGPSIYFDLDVAICGNLDYLEDFTDTFSAPANWAHSGWGGIQSSVMAWPGNWHEPYHKIKPLWPNKIEHSDGYTELGGKRFWGDQEFLWDMLGDDWVKIPGIYSYKYHCRDGTIPEDASTIVFHGPPKPIEVTDPWILPFTRPLHNHINSNTSNGSSKALSG